MTDEQPHDHAHHAHGHFHSAPPATTVVSPPASDEGRAPDVDTDSTDTIYTCPMHPEIRRNRPGNCPICGMTLEPLLPASVTDENPELRDFTRRFWWTLPLTVAVTVLAMFGHRLGLMSAQTQSWVELVLS